MATKKTVTKKDLERKIKSMEFEIKQVTAYSENVDRMLSISRDNEQYAKHHYETEEVAHRQTKRRANAAANLLKGTNPVTAEIRMKVALGLLANRPLVDVAEDLASDVDPMVDVMMISCGPRKIEVIKTLRNLFNLGLKESKDVTDRAPTVVTRVSTSRSAEIFNKLEAAGATMEIRSL